MIVVDASAIVALLIDSGGIGATVAKQLHRQQAVAPHLIDIEVTSALLGRRRGGKLTDEQLNTAFGDFRLLRLRRFAFLPMLNRVRELYDSLSPYDASYVALAQIIGVSLLTCDARIARSGSPRCQVEVCTAADPDN